MANQQQNTNWGSALLRLTNSVGSGYLVGGALLVLVGAGALMLLGGLPELPQMALGHPPSSVYGLWAAVATVTVSGTLVHQLTKDKLNLRLEHYGGPPAHWPSVLACSAVGSLSFLLALDEPFVQAISRGLVGGLVSYLVVGRVWHASWLSEWNRKNAHIHRIARYVVEGQATTGAAWTFVGSVEDVNALQKLRSHAHAQFKYVRFWQIESNVALMQSEEASSLIFSTPLDASTVPEQEARNATRA